MAQSLSTIRSRVRTELKIDNQKNIWTDSVLDTYINQAYLQVQIDGDLDWAENLGGEQLTTTISGTPNYALPTDLARIDLVLWNDIVLKTTTKDKIKRRAVLTTPGSPDLYYIQGNEIFLFPVPDSGKILDIDYRKRLATLVNDSDTIDYPDDFVPAIVHYSSYLAWLGYGGGSAGNSALELQAYEISMNTLKIHFLIFTQADLRFDTQYNSFDNSLFTSGSNFIN